MRYTILEVYHNQKWRNFGSGSSRNVSWLNVNMSAQGREFFGQTTNWYNGSKREISDSQILSHSSQGSYLWCLVLQNFEGECHWCFLQGNSSWWEIAHALQDITHPSFLGLMCQQNAPCTIRCIYLSKNTPQPKQNKTKPYSLKKWYCPLSETTGWDIKVSHIHVY